MLPGVLSCTPPAALLGSSGCSILQSLEWPIMDEPESPVAAEAVNHLNSLYNLARWLTRDPVEAEDLVQETYVRAFQAAHQFRPGTNLRAWLFQILRNAFFTRYKRRGREPDVVDPEVLDGMSDRGGISLGREAGVDRRLSGEPDGTAGADLAAAVNRLPEQYRTVVVLADVEDFTMGEIAEIMYCPVGTVKSRLFRARVILKELLRDYVE
jgi:RNA polymerase sigma-70 factor (ECF subfamily)